jgi:hypothetical protein
MGVTCCLIVAFLRGDPACLYDRFVMEGTGGPFVHTEVVLRDESGRGRAYTALERVGGVVPVAPHAYGPEWALVCLPLAPAMLRRVYAGILGLLAAGIPYNTADLWQCCVPLFLPFETDLDCARGDTWRGGVFCSQLACLLLRRAARDGCLPVSPAVRARLESVNSRGCSPNALFRLLRAV